MFAASFHSAEDSSEFLPHGIGKEMIIVEDTKERCEEKISCLDGSLKEDSKPKTFNRSPYEFKDNELRNSQSSNSSKKSKLQVHTSRIEDNISPKQPPLVSPSRTRSKKCYREKNNAGERLYARALEQAKKLEMKRLEKGSQVNKTMNKSRSGSRNISNQSRLNRTRGTTGAQKLKKIAVDKRKSNPMGNKTRTNRLYDTSSKKQEEGKKLREEIAKKSKARNSIPNSKDFGTISISKAQEMYEKGIIARQEKESKIAKEKEKRLLESEIRDYGKISKSQVGNMYRKGLQTLILKELKIAEKQQKMLEWDIAMHEFKLAEGAFALQKKSEGKEQKCVGDMDNSSATTCSIRSIESDDCNSPGSQISWNNRKEGVSSAKMLAFREKYM